jgi:hypothetical protein
VTVGELARVYGFTDVDGSQPDAWAFMAAEEAASTGGDPVHPEDFR